MNEALIGTALLLGVAGAPHCAAMCGAACAGVTRGAGPGRHAMLAMQAGRMASYAAVGAMLGAGVAVLGAWTAHAAMLRPLWVAVQAAALALGVWLLVAGRQPAWLARIGSAAAVAAPVQPLRRMSPTLAAAASGGLFVMLPCGLLQSALLVAMLGAGPVDGAVLMAVFAAGSGVGLWAGPALWDRALVAAPRLRQILVRTAGLLLMAAAAWSIARIVGAAAGIAWLCA